MSRLWTLRDAYGTVTVPGHVRKVTAELGIVAGKSSRAAARCHTSVTVTVPGHGPRRQWPVGAPLEELL